MEVIHIVANKPTISEVPNDWEMCEVLREYLPPVEFTRMRRVSEKSLNMGLSKVELKSYMDELAEIEKSEEFEKLRKDLLRKNDMDDVAITVSEMIKHLESLDPNSKLLICKQNGTSADPEWSIHKPMKYKTIMDTAYYSIGLTTNFHEHPVIVNAEDHEGIANQFYNGEVTAW